jgi:hypothetical protein
VGNEEIICPDCGSIVKTNQRRCPKCNRQLSIRWPDKPDAVPRTHALFAWRPGETPPKGASPLQAEVPLPPKVHNSRLPVWIEFIGGMLGIHGLGMLLVRRYATASGWLIFSFFWEVLRAAMIPLTAGLGCLCLVPIGLIISTFLTISVLRTIRKQEQIESEYTNM